MVKTKIKQETKDRQDTKSTKPDMNGWQEIGDFWDEMFLFDTPGDMFEGIYLRTVSDIGPNNSQVHLFSTGDQRIGVWGSSALDNRMASCKGGHLTRVKFESLETAQKSGREYKDFKVWQLPATEPGFTTTEDDVPF